MATTEISATDQPDSAEAREAAKVVLASPTFARSKRGRELLAYLVDTTLDGRQEEIKAFSIACDVFGRDENFDADNDALVRVQAARVRTLLGEYYANEGKDDRLRISLPKGGYVPVFERSEGAAAEAAFPAEPQEPAPEPPPAAEEIPSVPPERSKSGLRPGLLVSGLALLLLLAALVVMGLPKRDAQQPAPIAVSDGSISVLAASFTKFSPDVSDRSLEFIRSQLLHLTQLSFVTIFSDKTASAGGEDVDPMEVARRRGIQYLLEGRVLGADGALRVNIDLLDVSSGKYVWTQSYDQRSGADAVTIDDLALTIMSSLHVVLMRTASRSAQGVDLESATPWDLFFLASWINGNTRNSLAWEKERIALARLALKKNPDFGPAYSVLASKLAFLANVDPASDKPETHAEARYFARQALEKAPGDADVVFNVALYNWHAGRIKDAAMLMRRTLDIAPHHPLARFLVHAVPYTCAPAPEAEIEQLVSYDSHLPSNSTVRWVTLAWIALLYLNNGDFAHAVEYGKRSFAIFHTPDSMYRLAAALAHAGATEEAKELIEDQQEYWPGLDSKHYAEVVIPRRCDHAPNEGFLRGLYSALIPVAGGSP